MIRTLVFLSTIFLSACTALGTMNASPPQILAFRVVSCEQMKLSIDRNVVKVSAWVDGQSAESALKDQRTVLIVLSKTLKLSVEHRWAVELESETGNRSKCSGTFFAKPEAPAQIRLDEIRTQGSGRRPDAARWSVTDPGSIAGIVVEVRSAQKSQIVKIFPDVRLNRGDSIVVHFQPSGRSEESDELNSPSTSHALDTDPHAWDFWASVSAGLPDACGAIVVRPAKEDPASAVVAWSKTVRQTNSFLSDYGYLWNGEELDSTQSTAVKTWIRISGAAKFDADSASFWKIAEKGESRIGAATPVKTSSVPVSKPRRSRSNTSQNRTNR